MFKAALKKFQTHPELRKMLIETGDCLIVENSLNDHYWGGGFDGSGENRLGLILIKVRKLLIAE